MRHLDGVVRFDGVREPPSDLSHEILSPDPPPTPKPLLKANHVGAPAIFALELACRQVCEAFGVSAVYLVGSAIERADRRDVDVRCIMDDDAFAALFPDAGTHWERDPRWLLLTVSISERLAKVSGLPIDFQFQPQTHANARHKGPRHAMGMRYAP